MTLHKFNQNRHASLLTLEGSLQADKYEQNQASILLD